MDCPQLFARCDCTSILVELIFLTIYWVSSNFIYERNVATVENVSKDYITDLAYREALVLSESLGRIQDLTSVLAGQTRHALATPYVPSAAEQARYGFRDGVYATLTGKDESASFYSAVTSIGPEQIDKVRRLSQIDPALKQIKQSNALISQVYFNSWDSYNRIYPYFDTWKQYPARMRIPDYNFYYEADARHNPGRGVVWTDAYLDPAGAGWMVSAIAPVYSPRRLEGVVGIDITIQSLLQPVIDMKIPWKGYAVLISREGTILALPPAAERDFGIAEVGRHAYKGAVTQEVFKPEQFDLRRRADLKPLLDVITGPGDPTVTLSFRGHQRVVAHSHVAGTKWTLLVVAPADEIAAEAVGLRNRLQRIGLVMAFALALFYVMFLAFLLFRTRALSRQLAAPLEEIGDAITKIGEGNLDHPAPRSRVAELDAVSRSVVGMARGLSKAYATIAEQQEKLGESLDHERAINAAQRRFIDVVSHELRTPLTMIDTAAQILQRRAERLDPEAVRERAGNMRRAVARGEAVIASMLQLSTAGDSDSDGAFEPRMVDVAEMLRQQANFVHLTRPEQKLDVAQIGAVEIEAEPAMLHMALAAVFDNAVRYGGPGAHIRIVARQDGGNYPPPCQGGCGVIHPIDESRGT